MSKPSYAINTCPIEDVVLVLFGDEGSGVVITHVPRGQGGHFFEVYGREGCINKITDLEKFVKYLGAKL